MIYQSAEASEAALRKRSLPLMSVSIGHLREEKDPLRTAMAVRNLPPTVAHQVTHVGQALDSTTWREAQG